MSEERSILLLGESDVGKTHYGAQLLKRLMRGDGALRMRGAASNLGPYESALDDLNEGRAAGHTATASYVDSVWPIVDAAGRTGELVWPDYGGEQVTAMTASRRVPVPWRSRVLAASAWLLLVRLQQATAPEDAFSRPLGSLRRAGEPVEQLRVSDQARLVELLQFLTHARHSAMDDAAAAPALCVLLTCWDELGEARTPPEILSARMPMLDEFIGVHWARPSIFGLSALGRSLGRHGRDMDFVVRGPESFGYVMTPEGERSADLTLPIVAALGAADAR